MAQNIGDGIPNTIGLLFTATNRYISSKNVFQLIFALLIFHSGRFTGTRPNHRHRKLVGLLPAEYTGLFNSVSSGGPEIPFRGGRVDAAEPNNPGVPQPEQNLKTHIAAFARQGFSQTDMISLVACGWVLP